MTDAQLFKEILSLPKELKEEVQDFIMFLKTKTKENQRVKHPQFGSAKGFFIVHDDFDEPLEDFKEYM